MRFDFLERYWPFYLDGVWFTVLLAVFAVLLGTILGTIFALMRLSRFRVCRGIAIAYIDFIRGTPLLVQLLIIFYALPTIGIRFPEVPWLMEGFPRFAACIVAMSINSAAYVAEVVRSGIQAVDAGQMEAARSLGLSHSQGMRRIILPQAIRNILPALGNEFVVVIKESSMCTFIGMAELMYNAELVRSATYLPFEPLIVAAVMYFLLTFTVSRLISLMERRWRKA